MGKSKDLATGASYVDTSGDTMTGTLVASTRLQVGDSSITQAYPEPSNGYVADFQASSGTQTYISIAPPNASSVGDTGTVIGEDATDTYIMQRGNKNVKLATQEVVRLAIDGSGRVTMPNQPSFFVQGNFGWVDKGYGYSEINPWYTTPSSNAACFHNDGSHFNLSNGRFTAPVAGRYQFNISVYVNDINDSAHGGRLYVNGTVLGDTLLYYANADAAYPDNTMSASYLLKLSANDYVSYYHTRDIYGYHSHFSGYLVG